MNIDESVFTGLLLKIIIAYASIVLLFSCDSRKKNEMNANFNIVIKGFTYSMDIKRREYIRRYETGDTLISFDLSEEEISDIYDAVNECDIFKLDNDYNPWGYIDTLPVSEMDITVINGSERRKIHIESATYFFGDWQKVKKIRYLTEKVKRIVHQKKGIVSLPASDFYLE